MARIVLINAGPWLTVPPQGYGGIESVIATLIPELRRNGVHVVLATVAASTIEVDEKIAVFPTPQFAHLTEPYNEVMGVAAAHMHHVVTWLQNRIDVDLVHDHLEVLGLTVLAAAGRTVPPVLHTLHWDLARRPTLYRNFQGAGRIWVNGVSSAQMAQAPAQLRACSLGHAHLASPLAQNASKRPSRAKCDHLVLVARITAVKGQHVAVRVAKRLGCELVLAGPVGPYQTSDELAADPHADRYPDVRYYRKKVAPLRGRRPDAVGRQCRWHRQGRSGSHARVPRCFRRVGMNRAAPPSSNRWPWVRPWWDTVAVACPNSSSPGRDCLPSRTTNPNWHIC